MTSIENRTPTVRTCMVGEASPPRAALRPEGGGAAPAATGSLAGRLAVLAYAVACYALFFGTFLYAAGFIGGFLTPTRLDAEASGPALPALAVNLALLAAFAVQHSLMARPAFKRLWPRAVPQPVERSTYVLCSSLALIALFAWWRPMGPVVWDLQHPVARAVALALFAAGFLTVLVTTFLIDHFELFGLRQAWRYARGLPAPAVRFVTPGPYRIVRHPMYVGWLLAFWATPTMTAAHLLFAVMTTAYILAAIRWEERDLMTVHPEYAGHRERVPMLLPRLRSRPAR
jgi:methanethiol S-methyltransferase